MSLFMRQTKICESTSSGQLQLNHLFPHPSYILTCIVDSEIDINKCIS